MWLTRVTGANKALVVMASGLGKTITAAYDVKEYLELTAGTNNGRVLVLCHSADILGQTKDEFRKIFGDGYSYGMYNGNEKPTHQTDFLFANLQSVNLHRNDFDPNEFCYIIVDEAHHSPAHTYRKAIEYFKPGFLLGLTATPERADDAKPTDIFGETVYDYDLVSAINDGNLSRIDYRLELDDLGGLGAILESGKVVSMAQLNREIFIPKRDEEVVELIRERSKEKQDPTMVIFCQTIKHAEKIAKLMGDAKVVHSKMSAKAVKARLKDFRDGKIKTLCAVNMMNEGIDIPRTDIIVFLRVTQSSVVFYQQLGRGLRLNENKDSVMVLDFVATAERIEQIEELKHKFREAKASSKNLKVPRESFTLNIDTIEFREREVDIIELIKRVREGVCHNREELAKMLREFGEKLGRTPKMEDLKAAENMPSANTYANYFGSWNKALEAAGFKPNMRYDWTREELIELLVKLGEKLGRTPKMEDLNAAEDMPSNSTYKEYFGSWNKALEMAGFKPNLKRGWTKGELIELLVKLGEKLGRTPKMEDLNAAEDIPSITTYRKFFGSWNKALEMAGFKPSRRRDYTREGLIELLVKFEKKLGRTPTLEDLKATEDMPSETTCLRFFGSWNKALEAAGLNPNIRYDWTREELIELLVKFKKKLGRIPKMEDVKAAEDMPSANTYIKYFGSWNRALEAAGLKPNLKLGWTREELIEFLVKLGEKLGRTPTTRDVNNTEDMPNACTYRNYFGSWNNALEAAGLSPNMRYDWTREELIELLVKLGEKLGRTPVIKDVGADKDMPSAYAYMRFFGSWNKALKAAGLK